MSILDQNLAALSKNHPQLAQRIADIQVPSDQYQRIPSKQGALTLRRNIPNGETLFWHSQYDPLRETARELQNVDQQNIFFPVIAGIGLGYNLRLLWDRHRPDFFGALIIEQDPYIFRLALEITILTDVLSDPRVYIQVGEPLTHWREMIHKSITTIMSSKLQIVAHPMSYKFSQPFYQNALSYLAHQIQTTQAEFDLMIRSGDQIQINMWKNFNKILQSTGAKQLKEQLQNKLQKFPAIVVAAGPSLDKNVHLLKGLENKALIIGVDTAYRTLLKHHIVPHVIVSTDPTELNLKHFEETQPHPNTILAFDAEVYYEIPQRWKGKTIYLNLDKCEFTRWLEQTFGPYGIIPKGGSVGHTAYFLARDIGADPIIFVGLDLAFDPQGGKTHTGSSALFREHQAIQSGEKQTQLGPRFQADTFQENIVWVPGIKHHQVPTSQIMSIYIRQFEEQFAQSQQRIIDATEGGSKLQGTEILLLADVIEHILKDQTEFKFPQTDPQPIDHAFIQSQLKTIQDALIQSEAIVQTGLTISTTLQTRLHEGPNLKQSPEWQKMADCFSQLYNSTELKIALEQSLFHAVYQFIQKEKPNQIDLRLKKYKFYFETFLQKRDMMMKIISP